MTRIYLHGLGQTPDSWEKTLEYSGGDEDCVCPDLTKTERGERVTYSSLYVRFSDMCGGYEGPVALCGLSLGAVLALNYAIDHPEKVSALVLIAAQYQMPQFLLGLQNILFKLMPKSAFAGMGLPKKDVIGLCRTMAKLDFTDSLYRVSCPTLVVCGEKDSANLKASKKLAASVRDSRLAVVRGTGHEVNVEAPEKLAELLRDFYASFDAPL